MRAVLRDQTSCSPFGDTRSRFITKFFVEKLRKITPVLVIADQVDARYNKKVSNQCNFSSVHLTAM